MKSVKSNVTKVEYARYFGRVDLDLYWKIYRKLINSFFDRSFILVIKERK